MDVKGQLTEGAIMGREDSKEAPIVCFKFSSLVCRKYKCLLFVPEILSCPCNESALSTPVVDRNQRRHLFARCRGERKEGCSSAAVSWFPSSWEGVSPVATKSVSISNTRPVAAGRTVLK